MSTGRARIRGILNGIKTRCNNKNRKDYPRYGGSGIQVCEEWMGKSGLDNFYQWSIENGYRDDLTIDRIDITLGYSPENCRWTTITEQCRNRSTNHMIEYNGETKPIVEWAEIAGIRKDTLRVRIVKCGWSMEKAMNTPVRQRNRGDINRYG